MSQSHPADQTTSTARRGATWVLVVVVAGLTMFLLHISWRAHFPSSLWISLGGLLAAIWGVGVIGAGLLLRLTKDPDHTWIDIVGSLMTLVGGGLTFVGFFQSATAVSPDWGLQEMTGAEFVGFAVALVVLSAVMTFIAALVTRE